MLNNPHLKTLNFPAGIGKGVSPPIYIHSSAEKDLVSFLDRSGNRASFAAKYKSRLQFLLNHRQNAVCHKEWFEPLKGENNTGWYSMRFNKSFGNLRILYRITDDSIILLHAFQEKKKKTDYDKAMVTAQERLKQI